MKPRTLIICILALLIIPLSIPSHAAILFENEFVRGTGEPVTESYSFSSEFGGPAIANLCNGGAVDGTGEKVSSTEVYLNEVLIFGPHNFNQNVKCIETPVSLNQGDGNHVDCTLKSKPGGKIWLQITQDPLRITSLSPDAALPGASVTISFTGDVDNTPLWAVFNSQNIATVSVPGMTNTVTFQVPDGAISGPLYIQQGQRLSNAVWFSVSESPLYTPDEQELVFDSYGKEVAVNLLFVILYEGSDSEEEAQRVAALNEGIIVGRLPEAHLWQIQYPVSSLADLESIQTSIETDPAVDFTIKYFFAELSEFATDWPETPSDDLLLFGQRESNRVKEGAEVYIDNVSTDQSLYKIRPRLKSIGVFESALDFDAADFDGYAGGTYRSNNIAVYGTDGELSDHGTTVTGLIAAELYDADENTGKNAGLLHALGNSSNGFNVFVSRPQPNKKDKTEWFVLDCLQHMQKHFLQDGGCKVLNLSWGYYVGNFSTREWQRLTKLFENYFRRWQRLYPNAVIVAAAGNGNALITPDLFLPQAIDTDNFIVVGAHEYSSIIKSTVSNYGTRIDIAATGAVRTSEGEDITPAKTSFSAPLVAATIAAMQSVNPDLTYEQTRTLLRNSALPINNEVRDDNGNVTPGAVFTDPLTEAEVGPGDPRIGQGARLNVEGAIQAAILSAVSPGLFSPENGATDVPIEGLTLEWLTSFKGSTDNQVFLSFSNEIEYCVTIKQDAFPEDISVYTGCDNGEFSPGTSLYFNNASELFDSGTTYYWAVWANLNGLWSQASEWRSFTTELDPNDIDNDGDTFTENQGDCDDTDPTIYPNAPELCDDQDNQCPSDPGYGTIDEGCTTGGLVAHWPLDGNANDIVGGNHGSVYGAIPTTDRFGNPNSAYYFDGVDDYIEIPLTTSLALNDYLTISAWVKFNSLVITANSNGPWVISTNGGPKIVLSYNIRDSQLRLVIATGEGGWPRYDWTPNIGQTYHFAGTFDKNTGVCKLYVDGVLAAQTIKSPGISVHPLTDPWYFGGRNGNGSFFNGVLDDVRFYNRALSESEIQELYIEGGLDVDDDGDGFTVNQGDCDDTVDTIYPGAPELCDDMDNQCPGDPGYGTIDEGCTTGGLVAHWPLDGNANDIVGGNHGTAYGVTPTADRFGNPNSAYHFDYQDYIRVDMNLDVFYDYFTIGVWVNFDHFNNDYPKIIHGENNNIGIGGKGPLYGADQGKIGFSQQECHEPGCVETRIGHMGSTNKLNTNQWYFITIVRNELNFKMYVNSQLEDETNADNYISMNGTNFIIGGKRQFHSSPYGGYQNFTVNGQIDDLRIYDRALSESEIQELYNEGGVALPSIPTGLSASYDSTNDWNWITWNSVSGADSYDLYWGTSPGVTKTSEYAGNTTNTVFSHTGVVPGWTYYYRVASVNASGESDLSNEVSAYVTPTPTINPTVSVSPSSGPRGTIFNEPGYDFTPNSTATLHFLGPDGSHYSDVVKNTDSSGNYTHTYESWSGTAVGQWRYYAVDNATGTQSNSVYYTIY